MKNLALLTCVTFGLLVSGTGYAQIGTIEVISNTEEAIVFVDSAQVGIVADRFFPVAPDTHEVSVAGNANQWNAASSSAIVIVSSGDTSRVALDISDRYRIETFPIGAKLTWQHDNGYLEELGQAPVTLETNEPLEGEITASLEGYQSTHIDAMRLRETETELITLLPAGRSNPPESVVLPTARTNHMRRYVDYGLVAGVLATAALAIHFKSKANTLDEEYRNPASDKFGDEETLQRIDRFDTYSGIALGASQVGLGVLAIRFILR